MANKTIGLVLSGGGYRGVAHLGVLRAMDELGIRPDYISGASAGAIVGAFYSAGYGWKETLDFFREADVISFRNYNFLKPGLLDSQSFVELFREYFPEDNFSALKIPLFISTTDLIASKTKYFYRGPLIQPLIASAAIPGVFSSVEIDGSLYCDGGVTNNFPTDPLLAFADQIIGVYLNPIPASSPDELDSTRAILERAYVIMRDNASRPKFKDCSVLIAPDVLNQFNALDNEHIDEIFEMGYREGLRHLRTLRE
ncbi:patatin-like phospholipase family protein [Lewinella sp. W8]|uniref:patatin-like phospholipase family protein n=1 Tax=Lewinella sp. W8 TaxID=2528208 RepID=UPI0010674C49|nr:patatin-like phospholipase family protein [Lewinella sp. W8]MTB50816.1 patatin [Lewinella sp. W8]